MGQYYMVVNLDRKEYLNPHNVGSGLKMWEIAASNLPRVIAYLLGSSTGKGGGDPRDVDALKEWGRWAGDRIIITGDYDEDSNDRSGENLYHRVQDDDEWTEVSEEVKEPFNEFIDIDDLKV